MHDLLLSRKYTLVVLMGTSKYDDKDWSQLEQVKNNLEHLEKHILNKAIMGIERENIVRINTKSHKIAYNELKEKVFKKEGIEKFVSIVFYFAGHGFRNKDGEGELYLTCTNTPAREGHFEAVKFNDILEEFNSALSHIQHKIIVLDCCYAGAIDTDKLGAGESHYYENLNLDIQGSYFIGAASRSERAGAGNTNFKGKFTNLTGVLLEVMANGIYEHEPSGPVKKIVDSRSLEKHLEKDTRLTAKPCIINTLSNRTTGKKGEPFSFFYNQAFSLNGIENLFQKGDPINFGKSIDLFNNYLKESNENQLKNEEEKIRDIALKMFDREFEYD